MGRVDAHKPPNKPVLTIPGHGTRGVCLGTVRRAGAFFSVHNAPKNGPGVRGPVSGPPRTGGCPPKRCRFPTPTRTAPTAHCR